MISSVLGGTWTILRSRLQVARNMFWRGKLRGKLGMVVLLLLLSVASYGLYQLSGATVRGLQLLVREQPELVAQLGDLQALLGAVPSIVFATVTLPLLISSIGFTLGSLYLARDLDILLVTPVPMPAVFLARFFEGLLPTYLLLFILLLPALVGYGLALGYGLAYVVLLPPALILLPLLPMSLGMLLTMGLVRILPPQRLREVMTVLSGLTGIIIYIASQFLNERGRDVDIAAAAARTLYLDQPWLPTSWAARMLFGAGTGDTGMLVRYGLPYVLLSLAGFILATALAERLYYGGWASIASTRGGKTRSPERQSTSGSLLGRGPAGAILLKDLRMLPRDFQRLSQLLIPIGLSLFWVWQLATMRAGRLGGDRAAITSLLAIALLVCTLIASNLGLTGMSREGRGYWLLQLAPISPWPILWAKWTITFLPFPIAGTLFTVLVGVLRRVPPTELLFAWTVLMLTGIGISGIITGAGAAFPRFDWAQAQRMSSLRAGCLAPIGYYSYGALMLFLLMAPRILRRHWGMPLVAGAWTLAIVLTALALLLPLAYAAARLRRLEL